MYKGYGMKKEILHIYIDVKGFYEVRGHKGVARMILFEGQAQSEYFQGKVLPGGVDCQKETLMDSGLSARYILEGTDRDGHNCKIFIENNGPFPEDGGMIQTIPKIITDSESLAFLEEAKLSGVVDDEDGRLLIRIFAEE